MFKVHNRPIRMDSYSNCSQNTIFSYLQCILSELSDLPSQFLKSVIHITYTSTSVLLIQFNSTFPHTVVYSRCVRKRALCASSSAHRDKLRCVGMYFIAVGKHTIF